MEGNVKLIKRIKIGDVKPKKAMPLTTLNPQVEIRGVGPLFLYVPKVIYLSAYPYTIYLHISISIILCSRPYNCIRNYDKYLNIKY